MSIKELAQNVANVLNSNDVYVVEEARDYGDGEEMVTVATAIELPNNIEDVQSLVNELQKTSYMGNGVLAYEDSEDYYILLKNASEPIDSSTHYQSNSLLVISEYGTNIIDNPGMGISTEEAESAVISFLNTGSKTIIHPIYDNKEKDDYLILVFKDNNKLIGSVISQGDSGDYTNLIVTDGLSVSSFSSKEEAVKAMIALKKNNLPSLKYKLIRY